MQGSLSYDASVGKFYTYIFCESFVKICHKSSSLNGCSNYFFVRVVSNIDRLDKVGDVSNTETNLFIYSLAKLCFCSVRSLNSLVGSRDFRCWDSGTFMLVVDVASSGYSLVTGRFV